MGVRVPCSDFTPNRFELFGAPAHEDEVEAFLGQLVGQGLSDSVGGSGDQGPWAVACDEVLLGSETRVEDPCGEGDEAVEGDDQTEACEEECCAVANSAACSGCVVKHLLLVSSSRE